MQVLYCIVLWFSHLRLLVVQVQVQFHVHVHVHVYVQLHVQLQVLVQVQGDVLPFALQLRVYFPVACFLCTYILECFFFVFISISRFYESFSFVLPATRQIEVILTRILEGLNLFLNLNNHRWQQFQTLSVRRQASTEVNIKLHI